MELTLIGRTGAPSRRYALPTGEFLIGRRPDCHIFLDAPAVAPRHARVFSIDGTAVIYRVADEWPVYVNGDAVDRRVLADGDDIELAHYRLRCIGATARDPATDPAPMAGVETDVGPAAGAAPAALASLENDPIAPGVPDDPPATDAVPGTGFEDHPPPGRDPVSVPAPDSVPTPFSVSAETTEVEVEPPIERAVDPSFHLDVLSGINRGRRVPLTRERVVLGFNRERLVEINQDDGGLLVRLASDQAQAWLNGEPLGEDFSPARTGDVLSVQRIELRIIKGEGTPNEGERTSPAPGNEG